MKPLRKKLLVAAVATSLSLGGLAVSAKPWGNGDDCPMGGRGYGRMGGDPQQWMERRQQRHAERMELLEARLKLTAEQQTAWKNFLAAQDAQRAERMKFRQAQRDSSRATTVPARFEERIQGMEQRLAGMKTMAKAAGDFYAVLNDGQKQVMDQFFSRRNGPGKRGGPGSDPTPEKADD